LPEDESVWKTLTSRFKVDLVCNVFVRGVNQGLVLQPAVIQMLTRRNIPFGVDIFVETDPEQAKGLEKLR